MKINYSERELIEQVLQGDQQSIRLIVEQHQSLIYSIAWKILGNKEDAEDASQETFMKAIRQLSNFKGESALGTWLYSIAYRTAIDLRKKRKPTSQWPEASDPYVVGTIPFDANPEVVVNSKEIKVILMQAISRLSADDAILVMLHYFQELTLKEVGEVMQLTESNAKVRLHRIRQKLFDMLKTKNLTTR